VLCFGLPLAFTSDMDAVYSRDFVDSTIEAMRCDTWRLVSRSYAFVIHVDVPRLCEQDTSTQVRRHGSAFVNSRLLSRKSLVTE
jgi:hypothetical protein